MRLAPEGYAGLLTTTLACVTVVCAWVPYCPFNFSNFSNYPATKTRVSSIDASCTSIHISEMGAPARAHVLMSRAYGTEHAQFSTSIGVPSSPPTSCFSCVSLAAW